MAVGVLEEALEDLPVDSPQRPEVLHALGLAHQRVSGRGQESDAIWCFTEVLQRYPDEARRLGSRYQLGVSYYRLKSYEEAIREFERYLCECPEGPLTAFAQERVEQCRDMLDATRSPSSNE
jgi:TolA-binding protein